MKLLDYIRGLRKGKEAHRLEKESMKDPFLADAMDGYGQVEGNHEQRIGQLRMQVSARATKKKESFKETEFVCCHLEHCRLPGNRYRYQFVISCS